LIKITQTDDRNDTDDRNYELWMIIERIMDDYSIHENWIENYTNWW